MAGPEEGKWYDVSGKNPNNHKADVTWPGAMYVQEEKIEQRPWYVFAYVHGGEYLNRVRVPCEGVQVEQDKVRTEEDVIIRAILLGEEHSSLNVQRFLCKALQLVRDASEHKNKRPLIELLKKA